MAEFAEPRNAWYQPTRGGPIADATDNKSRCWNIENDEDDTLSTMSTARSLSRTPSNSAIDGGHQKMAKDKPCHFLNDWIKDATSLLQSPELANITKSAFHIINGAFQLSLLPVTLPLHITSHVTRGAFFMIGNGVENVVCHVVNIHGAIAVAIGAVLEGVGGTIMKVFFWDEEEDNDDYEEEEEEEGRAGLVETDVSEGSCVSDCAEGVNFHGAEKTSMNCDTAPIFISTGVDKLGTVNNIVDGGIEGERVVSGSSCDMLRVEKLEEPVPVSVKCVVEKDRTCVPVSFVRVCDLCYLHEDPNIDVSSANEITFRYQELYQICDMAHYDSVSCRRMQQVLNAISKEAFEMVSYDKAIKYGDSRRRTKTITWKPENNTAKVLKKFRPEDDICARIKMLEGHILVWSGKFSENKANKQAGKLFHGQEVPLFKGKSILNMSPSNLAQLLLDSNRVHEYSKYSLGRKDHMILQPGDHLFDENILRVHDDTLLQSSRQQLTKIVKSETKLPFTNLVISLTSLVHAICIDNTGGYMIVSRTAVEEINSSCNVDDNEIIWGINLLRSVKGHPNKTELVSVNQGVSTLVPKFLTHRVGLKGLADFFQNVKNVCHEN